MCLNISPGSRSGYGEPNPTSMSQAVRPPATCIYWLAYRNDLRDNRTSRFKSVSNCFFLQHKRVRTSKGRMIPDIAEGGIGRVPSALSGSDIVFLIYSVQFSELKLDSYNFFTSYFWLLYLCHAIEWLRDKPAYNVRKGACAFYFNVYGELLRWYRWYRWHRWHRWYIFFGHTYTAQSLQRVAVRWYHPPLDW